MFGCKFLILCSKTTSHPIFPFSVHEIIIFTLSLTLRISMSPMIQVSCLSFPIQWKMSFSSQIYFFLPIPLDTFFSLQQPLGWTN